MTKELSGRTVDIIGTSNICYYFCDPTAGGGRFKRAGCEEVVMVDFKGGKDFQVSEVLTFKRLMCR